MSECSSIIWRRLRYMLTPQFDLYKRIGDRFAGDNIQAGAAILDYGCGTGFGTLQLCRSDELSGYEACDYIPHRIYGVDKDQDAVEFAADVLGHVATFVQADAFHCGGPWADLKKQVGSLSLVTVIEVIEHMTKKYQEDLVDELSDVTDPRGTLILSTPNKRSQFRKHGGHLGMHDPASLRALLSPHFADVALEDYLGEPVPDDTTVSPLVAICRGPR